MQLKFLEERDKCSLGKQFALQRRTETKRKGEKSD